jgi:hypothetical protein
VGDIKLAGFGLTKKKRSGKGKGKSKGEPDFKEKLAYIRDGERQLVTAEALRKIYWRFQSKGRVIEIGLPEEGKEEEDVEIEKSA